MVCRRAKREFSKKKGKPSIAPLNRLPLLSSDPGGVQQELVVLACQCKDTIEKRFITVSR